MRLRGLLAAAGCAALVVASGASPAPPSQLFGTVGPGFSITLQDAAGTIVSRIDPGTYAIQVRDLSVDHNFHLFGPGVEEATGVEQEGTVNWTATFREGRYTLLCDPHASQMTRQLTVGNPPAPAPTPPPSAPASVPKLLATVGPNATISLRSASGAVLRQLKPRTYSIVVRDRSKLHNFHLVGKGVNRRSTLAGTGTLTWKLKLSAGVLRFYSDRSPKTVKGSVKVG